MSLMTESPLHSSSSSDDFAAFLDAELETVSFNGSLEDDEANQDETDFTEQRSKRRKVHDLDGVEEILGVEEIQESQMDGKFEERKADAIVKQSIVNICPPHPGFFKGLCMRCGQLEEDDGSGIAFGYIHKDLKLGTSEIDRLRGADLKNLLHDKKLILILDLDHTLLNSTRLADVSSEEEYLLRQGDLSQDDPNRSLFKLEQMHMVTKLRPFLRTFLKEASSIFEMYVYTMAERSYALEIAKLLDPRKLYFDSRVISQDNSTQRHQKGLDVVLGAENIVVILDDTEFVWQKHKQNLILMERYHYFASSCRQFGFNSKSLSELKQDERESDGALANILNVLKRTHQMFFDPDLSTDVSSRDVRQVLRTIRGEILQGCGIVFSRLFSSRSVSEEQPIWMIAEQLGATCSTEVGPSITHVVSMDAGTQKARWALQNGKFLVSPRWIEAANYLWSRKSEEDFPVNGPKVE